MPAAANSVDQTIAERCGKHPKQILTELWHKKLISRPDWHLLWNYRDGDMGFQVEVKLIGAGTVVGIGQAGSKKAAQKNASDDLLRIISEHGIDIQACFREHSATSAELEEAPRRGADRMAEYMLHWRGQDQWWSADDSWRGWRGWQGWADWNHWWWGDAWRGGDGWRGEGWRQAAE